MQHIRRYVRLSAALAVAAMLVSPAIAMANPNDISLRGLGRPDRDAQAQHRFRALVTELGFAMAPRALQPAETLGMSGFEVALVSSLTDINQGAKYWQGQAGAPIFEAPLHDRDIPRMLWTPTLHIRKGLPLSTEVGVQATYLASSELFMLGGEFKVALHESYIRWFPAISARAAIGRLFGTNEIDLLTGEGDVMASLPVGLGGMSVLTPYIGYGMFFVHANSGVLDETPYDVSDPAKDQKGGSKGSLYSFETVEWQDNRQQRIFAGVRLNVAMIELLFEYNLGLVKYKSDVIKDGSIASYSVKLGFDI